MNPFNKCLVCYQPLTAVLYHPHCAKELFGPGLVPALDLDQEAVEQLALEFVNRRFAVPGVQRKLSMELTAKKQTAATDRRLTVVGYLGGSHILKPPTPDYPQMPEVEHLTMALAELCSVRTARHGLVLMRDNQLAYITKRFDRIGRKKIAVEDLCQLSEMLTEQKDRSSAERVGKVIRRYSTAPGDDALRYFELTVFCFITGNADMHMKNFSMLSTDSGRTSLAPAYDLLATRLLIPESDDPEELTLAVQGRKSRLNRANFEFLGEHLQIPKRVVGRTLAQFIRLEEKLLTLIASSMLSDDLKEQYRQLVHQRMRRLV